jgi:NAD(P)-dependent dehydrogenase (short-subunit alcohol dehydrogenase family)
MEIAGKVAIVTGAGGGGQGRAVALRLAAEGASVVVSDVDEAGGRETLRRMEAAGAKAAFFRADVASEADVGSLISFAEDRFGGCGAGAAARLCITVRLRRLVTAESIARRLLTMWRRPA